MLFLQVVRTTEGPQTKKKSVCVCVCGGGGGGDILCHNQIVIILSTT